MKHLYVFFILSIIIFLQATESKAQYVTLPDTNFRNYMKKIYPSCFNGSGQLDTVCTGNLLIPSLNIDSASNSTFDLTGLQYFKKIDTLQIISNSVSSLPALPSSITCLMINSTQLTSLPSLPVSLTTLNCTGNVQLTSLPQLPATLTSLICSGNQLTGLPDLPTSISFIECDANKLSTLPTLPASLTYLSCSDNNMTSLPSLPNLLQTLLCGPNNLTSLPALPNSLNELDCGVNKLNSLPALPPSLTSLICSNNNLYCMPAIPASINNFSSKGNHISCVYDRPSFIPGADTTYPICGSNNINNCPYDTHHVSLPDPAFSGILQRYYPSCFNLSGQLLDTTCSLIVNATSLNISYSNISDISGIHYFKNLDTLNCSGNNLTSLPPLPATLTYLDCSNNKLTSLPQLTDSVPNGRVLSANSLLSLNCQNNQLRCLPVLPNGLQTLEASGNPFTCVPNLPSSLTTVDGTYSICNSSNDTYGCIQQVTGTTNAITTTAAVDVFPNPSTGMVTINCPFTATGIKICGMEGKTALEMQNTNSSYTVDLSQQVKGVYVVQVFSANGVTTQKLVLE